MQQYEEVIFRLEERKAFLQKRIDKNKRWTDVYDTVSSRLPTVPTDALDPSVHHLAADWEKLRAPNCREKLP